ncbi:RIB43A-like with coiled-coils protein 1 [Poecilia latipinna]|uniref:RIB43A-like with coiled-coils protein 1 n=1 Tax=Poecilia latipinna TaxID=48699 RepID=A0A3B3USY4_9TELE|nr:PREDICTED: RIB43A-like with coiled-coils protein 1 [Poecilia latipinna]XP_014893402.1 PREDICTED: RIB43A-like with coiled-coils protein 1 [Poecilia latipinna]
MYKVDLPVDDSQDKVVEARRSAERARKARFFNPRQRVMGVDLDALNQQVLENKHKRSCEKLRNRDFDNLQRRQDEMLLLQDSNEKEKRKALQKDLNQFWDLQQQMKISHDVEVKGQYNLTIPESELGPSSMHIFEGEDRRRKERVKEQMRKKVKDLQEQMDDKKMRDKRAKHREMLLNNQLVNQDLMWAQQNAVEEERRKAALVSLWNDNQALAEVRALDRREQRRNEAADNLVEIWHAGTSDMLTETAEPAETYLGGGRPPHVLPDKWRGMSLAQLNHFHEQREQQRLEKKKQLEADKIRDAAWDMQLLKISKAGDEKDQKMAELRRQQRILMDQENKQLARLQQAHQHYLNKELYTNKPTRDYFAQFNTGCR